MSSPCDMLQIPNIVCFSNYFQVRKDFKISQDQNFVPIQECIQKEPVYTLCGGNKRRPTDILVFVVIFWEML